MQLQKISTNLRNLIKVDDDDDDDDDNDNDGKPHYRHLNYTWDNKCKVPPPPPPQLCFPGMIIGNSQGREELEGLGS